MSPRAVNKRARPGNEQRPARPAAPETPAAATVLEAADRISKRISQERHPAKAS